MLALEAELKFSDCETSVNEKAPFECNVAIVDLDGKYASADCGDAFVIGFSKNEKKLDTKLVKKCDLILHRPFLTSKLLEHLEVIERSNEADAFSGKGERISFSEGGLVTVDGRGVHLSENELALCHLLLDNKGKPVSREMIAEVISSSDGNITDVYISKLRRKLEGGGSVKLIHTVRGKGYMIKI